MTLAETWLAEGREKGIKEGIKEGKRQALLQVAAANYSAFVTNVCPTRQQTGWIIA